MEAAIFSRWFRACRQAANLALISSGLAQGTGYRLNPAKFFHILCLHGCFDKLFTGVLKSLERGSFVGFGHAQIADAVRIVHLLRAFAQRSGRHSRLQQIGKAQIRPGKLPLGILP